MTLSLSPQGPATVQHRSNALRNLATGNRTKPSEEPEDGGPADPAELKAEVDEALDKAPWEVVDAFQPARDVRDIEKAKCMMTSSKEELRLQGELLMMKVLLRQSQRGDPLRVA